MYKIKVVVDGVQKVDQAVHSISVNSFSSYDISYSYINQFSTPTSIGLIFDKNEKVEIFIEKINEE